MAYSRFLVFTISIIKIPENIFVNGDICTINQQSGDLYADCSYRNLLTVPIYLNRDIQVLNLTGNRITEINKWTIRQYRKLKRFIASVPGNAPRYCNIDPEAFRYIPYLQYLDLELNFPNIGTLLLFPLSIKVLKLGGTYQNSSSLDISYLPNLEEVSLFKNRLSVFPELHDHAPLRSIDLTDNPLTKIDPETIAQYCRLRYLYFTVTNDTLKSMDDCEKIRLALWIETNEIKGFVINDDKFENKSGCEDPKITDSMNENYKYCLAYKRQGTGAPLIFKDPSEGTPVTVYLFYYVLIMPIVILLASLNVIGFLHLYHWFVVGTSENAIAPADKA